VSEAFPALADLLGASDEPDPVLLLGSVLGSLPIYVLLTDRSPDLRVKYGSRRVLDSVAGDRRIAERPLADVLPRLAGSGVLELLREIAASGQARHFERFAYPGPRGAGAWDGAIRPLRDAAGGPGYLLVVAVESPDPRGRLSTRELEVAALVAAGLTNEAIADRLFVGRSTVATHVRHILDKLGFRSRSQVGAWLEGNRPHAGGAASPIRPDCVIRSLS